MHGDWRSIGLRPGMLMIWSKIMARYEEAIELTSPVAAQLLGTRDGKVVGIANLRAYFQRGLEAYPELRFSS